MKESERTPCSIQAVKLRTSWHVMFQENKILYYCTWNRGDEPLYFSCNNISTRQKKVFFFASFSQEGYISTIYLKWLNIPYVKLWTKSILKIRQKFGGPKVHQYCKYEGLIVLHVKFKGDLSFNPKIRDYFGLFLFVDISRAFLEVPSLSLSRSWGRRCLRI